VIFGSISTFKRKVNLLFSKLAISPIALRFFVFLVWFARFAARRFEKSAPDCVGGVFLNDTYKLIYIGNPKVASSTMQNVFANTLPESKLCLNLSYEAFTQEHPDTRHYAKFTFVRDPVDRIYSCWLDKVSNQKRSADIFILTRFKGLYPDMSFDKFVDWLCTEEGSDKHSDRHWMSQSALLNCTNPDFKDIEHINVTALDEVVNRFVERHGLSKNTKLNANRLRTNNQDLMDISNETREKIYKRYKQDYDNFQFEEMGQPRCDLN
jgi:hypothetical protein